MLKISHTPLQEGYAVALGNGVSGIQTQGGSARLRRTVLGSVDEVNVVWELSFDEYEDLIFTVEHQLARGTVPFRIDLVIDKGDLTEYKAVIAEDTFGLTGIEGLTYTVGATLLVQRPPLAQALRVYADLIGGFAFRLPGAMQRAMEEIKRN